MREYAKTEKMLTNELYILNLQSYDKEFEAIKILNALFKKNKLENEEESCKVKDSCYTAKYKMGTCPCELYR